jgi:hypothetical protein
MAGDPETYRWSRLDDETEAAYHAFQFYVQMAKPRSLLQAFRLCRNKPDATQAGGTWNGWCSRHNWVERAKAYDAHLKPYNLSKLQQLRSVLQLTGPSAEKPTATTPRRSPN